MMKKELKLVIGIIMLVTISLLSSCRVLAADPIIIGGNNTTTTNETTNTSTSTSTNNTIIVAGNNTTEITPTVNTTSNYNTTTTNTTQSSTLPKTGENDVYIVGALGLVCVISAVYAYRKIRNYNI